MLPHDGHRIFGMVTSRPVGTRHCPVLTLRNALTGMTFMAHVLRAHSHTGACSRLSPRCPRPVGGFFAFQTAGSVMTSRSHITRQRVSCETCVRRAPTSELSLEVAGDTTPIVAWSALPRVHVLDWGQTLHGCSGRARHLSGRDEEGPWCRASIFLFWHTYN